MSDHKVIILQALMVIVLLYRYLTVHGLDLYPRHLILRWSWPWPLNDLLKSRSRSKVTSRSNFEVTRSLYYKLTRSLHHSTDIFLFMVLTFTLDIWSWDDPDLDLWMTFTKFQVKGQSSHQGQTSRSQGHCITLQISYCSWPWPLS